MKPRILFLDIDGVLNSHQSFIRVFRLGLDNQNLYSDPVELRKAEICPIAWSNFLLITEEVPDLKIVISSTWRNNLGIGGLDGVREIFKDLGFDDSRIVGKTPRMEDRNVWGAGRGTEIHAWLAEYGEECDYVILDDLLIDSGLTNIFNTDPRVGLTYLTTIKVIEHFVPTFTPKEIPL